MVLHKASKRPKSPKISKMSIKMGNIRLFLAVTTIGKVGGLWSERGGARAAEGLFGGAVSVCGV
jgi:hypothetical protein